jgi:membrane protein implicated in regulation of membrane protease activity
MNALTIFGGLAVFVVGISARHAANALSLGGIALMGVGIGWARVRYKARVAHEREESELRAHQLRGARGEVPPPPEAGWEPPPINLN